MANEKTALQIREKQSDILKQELIEKIGKATATLLLQKTPRTEVRKRLLNPSKPRGPGNPEFSYLEHAYVSETLNFAFLLDWDLIITRSERIGQEAFVEGYIEVRFKTGKSVRKYGFGGAVKIETNRNQTWADVFKSAESDMLKNCAARLGLGLDLYRHEEKQVEMITAAAPKQEVRVVLPDGDKPATEQQMATLKALKHDFIKAPIKNKQHAADTIMEYYTKKGGKKS